MPEIPGIPNLQPVEKPYEDPRKAGQSGAAISDLGETALDITGHIREAQKQVDMLTARNELNSTYEATQDALMKTQNSRDVDGVVQQAKKTLNDVSAKWSGSPAAINIQMDADSLNPNLTHMGTVRQVDLMGKEGKIQLTQQGQVLAGDYAGARAAGDPNGEKSAVDAYTSSVMGLVKTGLIGDVEAQDTIRAFRQSGQELQIRNAITNANPEVNQKIYDDITANRKAFPDVTQEALDTFKGQALSAFAAHTKMQEWAQGQQAQNTMLVPLINQHTNTATGQFDDGQALDDVEKQFTDGKITATQRDVLSDGVKAHTADLDVGIKKQAGQIQDGIEKMFHDRDYTGGFKSLESNRPWMEENGLGALYKGLLNYGDAQRREQRTEARYEYSFGKEVEQENSQEQLGKVQRFISSGGLLTKSDIYEMAGTGKGKMSPHDVDAAWNAMNAYSSQPDFKSALDFIGNSFPVTKTSTTAQISAQDRKYAQTVQLFQHQVNAHPEMSKQVIAQDLMKSQAEKDISDKADQIFGGKATSQSWAQWFNGIIYGSPQPTTQPETPSKPPTRPASVPAGYEWNPQGNNGRGSWRPPSK